jgi:predicted aspartyl protease
MYKAVSLVCLAFAAFTQALSAEGESLVRVSGSRRTCVLSFEIISESKEIVQARLNGEQHNLLIDTGAVTFLDIDVARRLGLNPIPTEDAAIGYSGAIGKRWIAQADISLGDFKIDGCPVNCVDISAMREVVLRQGGVAIDGVLGADLLDLLDAQIDFRTHQLTIHRPRDTKLYKRQPIQAPQETPGKVPSSSTELDARRP